MNSLLGFIIGFLVGAILMGCYTIREYYQILDEVDRMDLALRELKKKVEAFENGI